MNTRIYMQICIFVLLIFSPLVSISQVDVPFENPSLLWYGRGYREPEAQAYKSQLIQLLQYSGPQKTVLRDLFFQVSWSGLPPYNPEIINEGYRAVTGPQILKVRIRNDEVALLKSPEFMAALVNQPLRYFCIIDNQDKTAAEFSITGARHPVLLVRSGNEIIPAQSCRGFFVDVIPHRSGSFHGILHVSAGNRTLNVPYAIESRHASRLQVKILDEDGTPAAARVYLTGSDGRAYAPSGALHRITYIPGDYYFHADGQFQVDVPEGLTAMEIVRGFEYEPVSREIYVDPLHPKALTVQLKRRIHMAKEGWYSCDMHLHGNYHKWGVVTHEDMMLQMKGDDLNIANMNITNADGDSLYDIELFHGLTPHPVSEPEYLLLGGMEMHNLGGLYGHLGLMGLTELIQPIYTGTKGTQYWEDYPMNTEISIRADKQGAAVCYVHPQRVWSKGFEGSLCKEAPVVLAAGVLHGFEVLSCINNRNSMDVWYHMLNTGFPVAISGGSDGYSNILHHFNLGSVRTYVKLEPPLTVRKYVDAFRKGHSFATNGPMVFLTVNGKMPGETINLSESSPVVSISVKADSYLPLEKVEIVANGRVVHRVNMNGKRETAFTHDMHLSESAWIAARVYGPAHRYVTIDPELFAHTTPVYCQVQGKRIAVQESVEYCIDWVERLYEEADRRGRFATAERKQHVLNTIQKAKDIYAGFLSEY